MAERKTVTQQTMIGEGGIALISTRYLEMGFIFHPRRVDHGIDGHIDLVDPGSGALLNQVLLVQSKASDGRFPFDDEHSFRYPCDPRDLDLWLSADVKAAFPDAESRASRTIVAANGPAGSTLVPRPRCCGSEFRRQPACTSSRRP